MNCKVLRDFYRNHIISGIMPFWDKRCIDRECGGYLTCFDRAGNLTDDAKYIWFQGRQLYVYALLYNQVEPKREWYEAAEHGFTFLKEKAYAGNGRWNYVLDRRGNVLEGTCSVYADMHVMQGLAEYNRMHQGKSDEGMELLRITYDVLEHNFNDLYFKDIYENTWQENHIWHDMYLTALSAIMPCIPLLGKEYTASFLELCIDKICNWFARDDYQVVFETVTWDNRVLTDTPQNRFVNPGHMSESAWFLLEYGRKTGNEALMKRGRQIEEWTYNIGYDTECGGLNSYVDAVGNEPVAVDWHLETNSLWNDKVWWANAEQLCTLIKTYESSREEGFWRRFLNHHNYCMEHFYDAQYGEWYERLWSDGTIKVADKGTKWKCAFHLVRALVHVMESLERMAEEE